MVRWGGKGGLTTELSETAAATMCAGDSVDQSNIKGTEMTLFLYHKAQVFNIFSADNYNLPKVAVKPYKKATNAKYWCSTHKILYLELKMRLKGPSSYLLKGTREGRVISESIITESTSVR